MTLFLTVDNKNEKFGADTTIADLAVFSLNEGDRFFNSMYGVEMAINKDWLHEVAAVENDPETGVKYRFTDDSILLVAGFFEYPSLEFYTCEWRNFTNLDGKPVYH